MTSAGRKLLIVDDDARVRELAEYAARKSGHFGDVVTAKDGTDAIRLVWRAAETAKLPDVILTDLSMPGMDGVQFTRALKAHPATQCLPVFMFSSSGQPNDRESALAVGCEDFFLKPASLPALVDLMRAIDARLAPA